MSLTTLGKIYEAASSMSRSYRDEHIAVEAMSFDSIENIVIDGQCFEIKAIAQQSIANRLGIPIHYLRKCPADIQQKNLNYWIKQEKNEKLFIRFDDNKVRAVFTPRYIPTDNLEVLDRLLSLGYKPESKVQGYIDSEFMMVNIPDHRETFSINKDKMTPGMSVSNSEVGLASLSISSFVLRLICTNGMIMKEAFSASYRHVSGKILGEFSTVMSNVAQGLDKQKDQLRFSLESKVENPESTIQSFNRQFELEKEEKEAVEWALGFEYGFTMFSVVNVYTKAAQFESLSAENRFKLQKVGGMILGMVN